MFIGEVIETLRAEEFLATKDRIHNAIRGGYLCLAKTPSLFYGEDLWRLRLGTLSS